MPIQRVLSKLTLRDGVVVLGAAWLVGSLAIPGFHGYVERSRVARAVSDIGTISLQLYRWQQNTKTLPANLAEAGLAGVDPWGRPYVYVRAAGTSRSQLRKNGALAPLNSDFDLYSLGADGESALALPAVSSRDDGAYIGIGLNY